MLFKQLALAAAAAAILIVPETSDSDEGIFRTLPIDVDTFEVPATAFSQSIDLPCAKCHGHDTHLKMDFAIKEHKLMLNGFELYPNADPWQGDLSASVVTGRGRSRKRRLGYGIAVRPEGMDEEQHLEVVGVELRVIEVGDRFVKGIPPVKVKLIRAPGSELVIGNIEMMDSSKAKECSSIWCRAKGIFSGDWSSVKGKFKDCDGTTRQVWSFKDVGHSKPGHGHKGPHHGHPHGHPHGHTDGPRARWYHRFAVLISWAVFSYAAVALYASFTPVACVLLTDSRIGVLLCTIAIGVARVISGYTPVPEAPLGAAHKADIVEAIVDDDEKSGLMAEEAPPKYDESQV